MADCSYSRCVQQRRNIKRELQKWTKNMVYIVGLERIAEELMGRRKWKLYQESKSRSPLQQNHMINQNQHLVITNHHQKKEEERVLEEVKLNIVKKEGQTIDSSKEATEDVQNTVTRQDCDQVATPTPTPLNGEDQIIKKDVKIKEELENVILENLEEQERLKDWSPQSKCYFCVDGKLDSDHNNHGASSPRPSESDTSDSPSDSEAPPTLTPNPLTSFLTNNNGGNKAAMAAMESVQSMTALAAALGGAAGAPGGPPGGVAAFPYPHIFPPAYLNLLRSSFPQFAASERLQEQPHQTLAPEKTGTPDQPLDLSSKNSGNDGKITPVPKLPGLVDTKQIYKAKPRMTQMAGRRTYTEDELQAALRDIQSGKLGTRRAAVIYGIPRSTLRNKVYKLAMERERESHLNPAVIDDDPMEGEKELSGDEEEKEVEKALQAPLLSMADILRFSSQPEVPDALKAILLQRAGKEGDLWAGLEHSAVGPYIQQLLLQQQKPEEFVLPEMMKMIAEQHLNNGDSQEKCSPTQPSPANSVKNIKIESDMDTEESSSNVILKIPSFKPTTSKNGDTLFNPAVVSPPVTSESSGSPPIMPPNMLSLREAISKSIIEKFQQPETHKIPSVEIDFKRFTPPLGPIPVIKNHQDIPQKQFQHSQIKPQNQTPNRQQQQQQQQDNSQNNNNSGGKGTRPKRGKYRNYDRDSLVEAVRAVQRGEMSVHRAGSYYGVPHSTLEYKVKERHLMRPRKRDPKPNPVDEKIASLKQQDLARNNIPDKLKPAIKSLPPQNFPPTSPNGLKMPMFDPTMTPLGYTTPPFPFWPHPSFPHIQLEYPRNPSTSSQFSPNPDFYASQLMQRIQQEDPNNRPHPGSNSGSNPNSAGLPKSAREMAESLYDGSGANGSFLDGIIRSSLESGVPNDKNNKEDKGTTPESMSNKALIDQLCRNSRITPLPKASAEPNSSGDELCYKKNSSPGYGGSASNDRDSPIALNLGKGDNDDIHTVDLSNDSDNSLNENGRCSNKEDDGTTMTKSPPSRIYVKPQFQEVTKPENLKPEILLRFRDNLLDESTNNKNIIERNGSVCSDNNTAIGSASEDMVQD